MHAACLVALTVLMSPPHRVCAAVQGAPSVVQATGIGKPPAGRAPAQAYLMARRAAEVVAVRNLAAQLAGANDGPSASARGVRLQATLRGFRYVAVRTLSDGRVEVTVEMPLRPAESPPVTGGW